MKKLKIILATCLITVAMIMVSSVTVYAEPDNYLDEIMNGINNAADEFMNGLLDEEITEWTEQDKDEDLEDITQPTQIYEEPTVPTQPVTEDNYYDEIIEPSTPDEFQEITQPSDEPTEEPTEEQSDSEDYYYMIATEPETEYYQPEILTETYTDAPFLERLALTDAKEGNVFIALGLWGSIIVGVIIVLSIVISTHRRKRG